MRITETAIFTKQITELIDDESYAELQQVLFRDPESGDLIPRSRGLRKIRWRGQSRGKRGGLRVICYLVQGEEIFLVFAYAKSAQDDLTQDQLRRLRDLVDIHFSK